MCGILGFVSRSGREPEMEQAVARLRHRGPDDAGTWHRGEAALGFVRLSILDLSPAGHQPMSTPDGRYTMVFNGEIYNFALLREELERRGEVFSGHSDSEVLLRMFSLEGLEKCLARLRGMFAFAIWDSRERVLYAARDRLGVKPLVYAETQDGFLCSSEIQGLFALDPGLSRRPDDVALDHFLTFQYIPSPLTGFSAVRKLPPAHAMVVRDGRVAKLFRYWDVDLGKRSSMSYSEACDRVREEFLEATRLRLVSDVPLGAFLSGGVDSAITVAAMARLGARPLKTFSIGFEDEKFNELPHAREVASYLGTDHHEMIVRADAVDMMPRMIEHLGEPLADNSVIPTYYVSKFARQQVTVALTGDGGDEVFAGYRRFYQMRRVEWLERHGLVPFWRGMRRATVSLEDRLKGRRRGFPESRADQMLGFAGPARYKHLLAFVPDSEKAALLTPEFLRAVGPSRTDAYIEDRLRAQGGDVLNRYLYLDLTTYLPEDILFKVDVTSMANSLECRSPFLDYKLIELAFSLPGNYKLSSGGRHKRILKDAFSTWLPAGFLDRPKKGFSVPLTRWLREDLSDMLRDTLCSRRTLAPWFRQEPVDRYVNEHLSGAASHSTRLWPLFVMALWVERLRVTP